jgi:predicted Zn finger-like uncharacterized protein
MKIVCDACQAKYSISDDKVQGKVFKIRCKKCSNIIVVRGTAGAAEAPAPEPAPAQEKDTRVYDYGYDANQAPAADDAVWHVVINQDQVGPMTAQEVQQRFAAGEIDGETYAWREGFADWMPLAQVDAFAELVASGTTTAAATGGGGAAAVASMFGGGEELGTVRSDPGDLFAAASASAAQHEDDGNDLFGSKPASASASASAAASAAANAKLRGERNENSVLFSLNNLAQLASDRPAPAPAAAATAPGHATGAAGGEGSGLIDIRSMASAYLGGGGAAKPAASAGVGSIDDLPVFGGGGFSEPAVIVPQVRTNNNSKLMYALIGSVGLLAVAAVILVVVLLKGGKDDKPSSNQLAASTTPDRPDEVKPTTTTPTTSPKPDEAKPEEPKPNDTASQPAEDPKRVDDAKPAVAKKDEPKRPTTTTPKRDKPTTVAKNDPPPKKEPKDSGGCDEVSCVLNNYEGACCAKYKKGGSKTPTPTKPASNLPDGLDRTMISSGLAPIKAKVSTCGDKSSKKGTVKVSVKVTPAGTVAGVTVKEQPDAALGTCVAGIVKGAKFEKTQNGGSFNWAAVF